MKICVEGCAHGELEEIYRAIKKIESREGFKIDLLLCCGDFQAVRNAEDLACMSVPMKFKRLGTFYKYYSGELECPVPTIFIGGNHEAQNYLWELYYGGFCAKDVYYLGHAGCVRYGDLRVGGLSGIYKKYDYRKGHFERVPYANENEVKTAYHVREFDAFKLKQIKEPVDVFLSHDWPRGIERFGDLGDLLRKKKFLKEDVEKNELGSVPAREILMKLKPEYWFSAHLHVKFEATVDHENGCKTYFLALDKCMPYSQGNRQFLQVIDMPDKSAEGGFQLDPEWLAITKANHEFQSFTRAPAKLPDYGVPESVDLTSSNEFVRTNLHAMKMPEFCETVPAYDENLGNQRQQAPEKVERNPQTIQMLEMLQLDFKLDSGGGGEGDGGSGINNNINNNNDSYNSRKSHNNISDNSGGYYNTNKPYQNNNRGGRGGRGNGGNPHATTYRVPGAGPFNLNSSMPPLGRQFPPPPPPPPPERVEDPGVIDLDDI